jgi:hypothetical protein
MAFHHLAALRAEGEWADKQAAANSECIAMWLQLHPPAQRPGLCAHCGKTLEVARSSISGAPVPADGAWLHWACLPWFWRSRWDAARAGLHQLGIGVGSI